MKGLPGQEDEQRLVAPQGMAIEVLAALKPEASELQRSHEVLFFL